MTSEKTETRRRYSAAVKAQVVAECGKRSASVAKVAMAHGINANVVHRWRQLQALDMCLAEFKSAVYSVSLNWPSSRAPMMSGQTVGRRSTQHSATCETERCLGCHGVQRTHDVEQQVLA